VLLREHALHALDLAAELLEGALVCSAVEGWWGAQWAELKAARAAAPAVVCTHRS
jgi:hypothetical protein